MATTHWSVTVSNNYLGKEKTLKAPTQYELKLKVADQQQKWAAEEQRARQRAYLSNQQGQAESMTQEAQDELNAYRTVLKQTLRVKDRLNWTDLYDRTPFRPFTETLQVPDYETIEQQMGIKKEGLWDKLSAKRRARRHEQITEAKQRWEEVKTTATQLFERRKSEYEKKKSEYEAQIAAQHAEVDEFRTEFEAAHGSAIENYARVVLERSRYPESFNKDFEVSFEPIAGILVINFQIPSPEQVPHVESYKYVKARDEIDKKPMKLKEFQQFYNDFVCQVALRTIHEVFESIYIDGVAGVVFNGWVHDTDRATGKPFEACILSVEVTRSSFEQLQLENVDPLQCIRSMKGLMAGPLHQVAPVRPIMDVHRQDKRFVSSKDILDSVDDSVNLAEIDWESFEHLVRELFSKIFTTDGAEVQVTQASRDGGVDAIAFDPDPIRGGKYVIQAKRYNNVVPVSAVRDLYGTMINEGAVKGILVTTSYYGHDSREFVKDKPISLIDGSNLVYMMQEYGYKAKIELKKRG